MRLFLVILSIVISFQSIQIYAAGRQKIDIKTNWKFESEILSNAPALADYDDNTWSIVDIPHCWNATDAQDGGGNYLRTVGWYRKTIAWNNSFENKKLYLELQGACLQTECFVNGESVGYHKGGYTAFRVDITSKMRLGGNIIAIKVDNRLSEEIMPLGGDFSFMGGIYRDIHLIVANEIHVDLMDNGSSGLYLTTSNVSRTKAELEIKAKIVNNSAKPKTITIDGMLRHPDSFEAIADIPNPMFNIAAMPLGGESIKAISRTVTIFPRDSFLFKEKQVVDNPRLWNGKKDPYRYQVDLQIKEEDQIIDEVSQYVGFRYFSVTKDGFFLNGNLYPLRGVNRHQDRYNMGYAITSKEHNEDFAMIYDMGANAVRFAHYPHDSYIYDLCDKYGLIAWAEIPLVDRPGKADTFNEVTKNQLRELIRQQYNRPSIFFWGLQNEVRTHHDAHMQGLMKELNDQAHLEDPYRLTVQATNHTVARNWNSDLFAWNYYPGWYVQNPLFGEKLDDFKISEPRPTALSEYGAGGSIYHHESRPQKPVTNGGKFHPEEYQNKVHEQAISDFSTRDFVWGTFLWNMFDFASDNRNEGDHAGMNDKGLVTYDRKVKKDSYYAYKANWNNDPMVYISSRRYVDRKERTTPITIYSNCTSVELFVNKMPMGRKMHKDVSNGFFRWENIELLSGENTVKVVATKDNKEYTDEVIWNKISETSADDKDNNQKIVQANNDNNSNHSTISSNEYKIDIENKTIRISGTDENKTNLPIDKFLSNITFSENLSYNLNSISYFIQENDELVITDNLGAKTVFKLVFGK